MREVKGFDQSRDYAKLTFSVDLGQLNLGKKIIFNQKDGIARLCLNNPEKHNALGLAELDLIETALNNISNETRVLIIKSFDDRTFCSGANLSQILEGSLNGERFQSVTNSCLLYTSDAADE